MKGNEDVLIISTNKESPFEVISYKEDTLAGKKAKAI